MIRVRRGTDRFRTLALGLDSWHSFSYGRHYDPDNLRFGVLMAHNEDRLAPGAGFDRHPHRGLDIVTWVLSGTLEHQHWTDPADPADRAPTDPAPTDAEQTERGSSVVRQRLTAGMAQVLRTGSGVHHAEHAAAGSDDVHYVQMWLASAEPAPGSLVEPGYERRDFTAALAETATTGLPVAITVAAGRDRRDRRDRPERGANRDDRSDAGAGAPLGLSQPGVELAVARLPVGAELRLPSGPLVHVFIARGVLTAHDHTPLAAGDALRQQGGPAPTLVAVEPSEVLVWTLSPG